MDALSGVWLSINDYSKYKKVSVSTIRRHIKNKILKFKEESGKYYIYVPSPERIALKEEEELLRVKLELELLRAELRRSKEEVNELRMLVNLYEKELVPELPLSI